MKKLVADKTSKTVTTAATSQGQRFVYQVVLTDRSGSELLIGRDCIRLTRAYVKFGVSAHVLPGLVSDTGLPLFTLIGGNATGIRAAVASYLKFADAVAADRQRILASIRKVPVAE